MVIDRFTKVLLLAIVVLLMVTLMKSVFEPQNSYAGKTIKYLVVPITGGGSAEKAQEALDKYGADGWEFVAVARDYFLIFRK